MSNIRKRKNKTRNKKNNNTFFIAKISLIAFFISALFTMVSETIIKNVNIVIGIMLVLLFVLIGIIFDMIGVAVTTADEAPLHSMAAKKVHGATMAIRLKKNADKVSSFCNDVVGDICGIVSGSAGAVIVINLVNNFNWNNLLISILVMSLISAITIGGKASEKTYALKHSNEILLKFSKVLILFSRK